jgi:hypothetical protein
MKYFDDLVNNRLFKKFNLATRFCVKIVPFSITLWHHNLEANIMETLNRFKGGE